MTWVIRFLLITLLLTLAVRALMRLFAGIVEGASGKPGPARSPQGTRMVKDPICGTWVVPSRALTASKGEEVAFFCSADCQRAWQRR